MAQRLERAVLKCPWCPGRYIDLNQDFALVPELVSGQDLGTMTVSLCQASAEVQSSRQLHYSAPGEPCKPGLGEFPSVPKSSPSPGGLLTPPPGLSLNWTSSSHPPGHGRGKVPLAVDAVCSKDGSYALWGVCEPLPDSYRADLVVQHHCAGTQRVRGEDHNWWVWSLEGQKRAEGTSHSSRQQLRSEQAPSPWDVFLQPVLSCSVGVWVQLHCGEHGYHGHVSLPAKTRLCLHVCIQARSQQVGAKVCRVELTVPDSHHINSICPWCCHLFLSWAPGAQQPSLLLADTAHSRPPPAPVYAGSATSQALPCSSERDREKGRKGGCRD